MEVQLDKLLEQKGKTRYWLSKQIGMSYQNIMKLCRNETSRIDFDVVDKICKALDCDLDEWLIVDKNKE